MLAQQKSNRIMASEGLVIFAIKSLCITVFIKKSDLLAAKCLWAKTMYTSPWNPIMLQYRLTFCQFGWMTLHYKHYFPFWFFFLFFYIFYFCVSGIHSLHTESSDEHPRFSDVLAGRLTPPGARIPAALENAPGNESQWSIQSPDRLTIWTSSKRDITASA